MVLISEAAIFNHATFSDLTIFAGTTFANKATFLGATFKYEATFESATFVKEATFAHVTFSYRANFERTTFSGGAEFNSSTFRNHTIFEGAKFDRSSNFIDAEMKGETSFEGATFDKEPPCFFGAKFHQATVWRGITWPPQPKDKKKAGAFIDAYACLKLEMDRLKKHEDEFDFFALELQSRRMLGLWWGLPIWLYGVLSGYGRSYLRPLGALFLVAAMGAWAFWNFDARTYGEALGVSAANTLNVFGFRRDFNLAIDTPLTCLEVLAGLQTILGTILLFLFGLGVRNRFRIK